MRRLLRLPVLALAVTAGSLSAPASADPPEERSWTAAVIVFVATSDARTTGDVVHQDFRSESVFVSGGSSGSIVSELQCRTVGDTFRCSGVAVFTGTIEGVGTGKTTGRQHFTCIAGTFECEGRFVTFTGTGGLAGYRDVGTYASPNPEGLLAGTSRVLSR